ncbi:MAG: quinone-dependent dihydroorotate dehydrogenase, partial [Mesorhizobium sp.]|nr:quinone-dependent dihydroorotate dehydrogenase [Mesorhizobium sp.]
MLGVLEKLGRRALFCLDPETAHGLSIQALKSGVPVALSPHYDQRLRTTVAGLAFDNPLGMAAGYDKNAEAPDALLRLGFGFVEVGTITPLPQSGNPKPRIFRLTEDQAVINRLGFNNEGHDAAERRLAARAWRAGTVGVNIGANKDSADRMRDYELGVERFTALASYLTVNISSPNTPGLRDMQARASLAELLSRVVAARDAVILKAGRKVPLFLKIAPDLHQADLEDIAAEVLENRLEGVIVSNTTIARPALKSSAHAAEAGGLSGRPLFERSTVVLARVRKLLGPDVAIIGVGGVDNA